MLVSTIKKLVELCNDEDEIYIRGGGSKEFYGIESAHVEIETEEDGSSSDLVIIISD